MLTPWLRRNRSSDGEDHVEASDASCAQRASTVANRYRSLEQTVTPFRGRNTTAPDLLQLRSINRPLRTHKDRLKDCMMDRLRSSGRHLVMRCRPELPSGRQDLNLRPLDPQRRPATPPTCGNRGSAGRAVQFEYVQRSSTQPDAGRCSRSAPEVPVNESHRAPGRARHGSRLAVGRSPSSRSRPLT